MSASDKKKVRREQNAALLTEKQKQQKAEAKKLKIQTTCFVVAMVLVVCAALGILAYRAIDTSGIIQKNTIAATVGNHEISAAELNYYYVDAVNKFYNEWYSYYEDSTDDYLKAMGLDTSLPLDEQIFDEEAENPITWAQYFLDTAIAQAKNDYALYDKAMADSAFSLPEEDKQSIETTIKNLDTFAMLYGYSSANQYIRTMYGNGCNTKNYQEYLERSEIATAYSNNHQDSLIYEDAAIREYEADKKIEYNCYTYTTAYLSYTYFQQGGTEGEDGKITYSDEENAAARATMQTVAEDLATATSVEELNTKVEAVEVKEGSTIAVKENKNVLYTSIDNLIVEWVTNAERKEGDITAIANTTTEGDNAGVTNGYYVVIFHNVLDNTEPMGNVRHLLVKFEGGTKDEETNKTVYSDEEKAAAKEEAEGYLKTWKEGAATEESFIELVKEHSDDTSAETGGLFEDINPNSSYVEPFLSWSINPDRKAGDAEVIETEFGYHVMFYVGDDELSYRDFMLTNEMRTKDQETWYNGIVDAVETTIVNTKYVEMSLSQILFY